MGLDDFSTGSSTRQIQRTNTIQNSEEESEPDSEPFKVVNGGKGRHKIFPTEAEWEETVDFIETEFDKSISEVMEMKATERHDLLHQAILEKNGIESTGFHRTDECIVCGEIFIFPNSWNFTRFKGEATCNDHSIGEVVEAVGSVNALKG